MEKSFTYRKPSTRSAWSLVESVATINWVINRSRQSNYNIAASLFQVNFAKGGMLMYILRASITTKDGNKIYARDYGKRAFRIWIGAETKRLKKSKR